MSVHRIMGIETEYGISVPGRPHVNAMMASSQVVNAYAVEVLGDRQSRARWDYDEESPLRDARGFDQSRAEADPSQLTDEDLGLANVILTNGARLYVDHAHPEYSTPEVTSPRDAVLWDKAGERVMARAASLASALPGGFPLQLYKNNTDNKGASYGTHENYLLGRETPFSDIVTALTPFFVSRQVIAGSGRIGIGQDGNRAAFQLSQRADFFEVEVGLETTIKRPIINTRDEPHADPEKYRRLHVIIGDANLSEIATYLKMGTTALVLSALEAGVVASGLFPEHPVAALHAVSHDPELNYRIALRDGRKLTAVQLQWEFLEQADKHVNETMGLSADEQTRDVLRRWSEVLTALESDPMSLADQLDWVAKKKLLDGYRRRDSLDWDAARLALVDLQYSDVNPVKGLAQRLQERGALQRITTDAEVAAAVVSPPDDTRAWFRGECIRRYGDDIVAASWDSVIFDLPERAALQRVPTLDPFRGTRAHVGELLDRTATGTELVQALTANE
ncbi:MAG: proteasome accessory factor PafA2 [Actinomycetia bacterium]|nr:proteasome accessory factor PafA2 [Actinomycetes bacterium]MCH9800414.1 proteasome accessory factor PafA2 [Actinomycetes bacterium]